MLFHDADDHSTGGEASGLFDQAVPGALAGDDFQVRWPYDKTHHPAGDTAKGGRRADTGLHAAEVFVLNVM